ncbi:MAG: glycosyltransferase, partial [Thiogranum sp.]
LVGMRGGEKVLEALCELYPDADIFTHVCDPDAISETLRSHRITSTFIQCLPRARAWYQRYLPLMPLALEQLDLRGYDLVISSESGPAKGIVPPPESTHICYCHSPMRYVWDMYHDYLADAGRLTKLMMPPLLHYMRTWDVTTAPRVDHFIANSSYVAARIRKYYRRDAKVIHPPVDTMEFSPRADGGDFYLMMGQLTGYKRADLAVEAFNETGKPLVIIGEGEMRRELEKKAGANIRFMGWQPFESIKEHYARCRALIFPGTEDFGIVPVEAMASGRPVIAYRRGGATETVVDGVSGLFFDQQTVPALIDAVRRFEAVDGGYASEPIIRHAKKFDREVFKQSMKDFIDRVVEHPPG